MKITETQAEQISAGEVVLIDGKEAKLLEKGEWIDDGKYSIRMVIFTCDGKNYMFYVSRSGSYFTEYNYDFDTEAHEVEKVAVTTMVWKLVERVASEN